MKLAIIFVVLAPFVIFAMPHEDTTTVYAETKSNTEALPVDPVIKNLAGDGPRYQYVQDADSSLILADLWLKASDLEEAARFNPDRQNVYHLFTRQNPTVSQPLLLGVDELVWMTNYNPARRTIFLIHGWRNSATSAFNTVLVPAYLAAQDVNVIVVDWSAGANTINYAAAVSNTVASGESVARFVTWLMGATGAVARMFHIIGHSLGGHQSGIVGRNVGGDIAYITGLDPALPGWLFSDDKFRPTDGVYTEVIHTNAGLLGYTNPLADVDFYPNGGTAQPGCGSSDCDHSRAYYFMAESLTSGGFTGRRCSNQVSAILGNCLLPGNLRMGGVDPKTGSSGIFHLLTNAGPPFSQG